MNSPAEQIVNDLVEHYTANPNPDAWLLVNGVYYNQKKPDDVKAMKESFYDSLREKVKKHYGIK